MKMHLLCPPNTQQVRGPASEMDGFAALTLRFCDVLARMGVEVHLYGSEERGDDVPCARLTTCISKTEIAQYLSGQPYQRLNYSAENPVFQLFNSRAVSSVAAAKSHGDMIGTIVGAANFPVAQSHPDLRYLEWSIGYQGIAPQSFRVFQSHAWRHANPGYTAQPMGREFDAVIPPFYDTSQFPTHDPEDYVLFVGRTDGVKGGPIAARIAREAGVRFIGIGYGDASAFTSDEWRGSVSTEERNRLLAGARAVLMPTRYLEPFGQVAAEAQLCGTPVIGPDFGAFIETIDHGVTGFRCSYLGDYIRAVDDVRWLDRAAIRARAQRLWSYEAAVRSYTAYFRRLDLLNTKGWETIHERTDHAPGTDGRDCGLDAGAAGAVAGGDGERGAVARDDTLQSAVA
jgi:glycosyltransferase involved in cell wall biosynthesis